MNANVQKIQAKGIATVTPPPSAPQEEAIISLTIPIPGRIPEKRVIGEPPTRDAGLADSK